MNEITNFVDNEKAPVIFTKHGHGRYVFMSLEDYNALISRYELHGHLQEGLDDGIAGNEAVDAVAKRILTKHIKAFEELAK